MDNLLSLWKVLAQDMGERCAVDTTLDEKEVERRVEHEGFEFLTLTLPAFGKAIEGWLDMEAVDRADVSGFRFRQELPVFLGGFLKLVFNPENGVMLDCPSTDSILALRQLCGLYGKMFLPATPERTRLAMEQYIETDLEVGRWEDNVNLPSPHRLREDDSVRGFHTDESLAFSRIAMLLFHRVFDHLDRKIADGLLTPKHGPGSTAEGLLGNQKFFADWTWRLDEYFPSDRYLLPSPRYVSILDDIDFLDPENEIPVKVIDVPKTSKAPRIIAKEPVAVQYAQQAVAGGFVEGLDEDDVLKRFLRLDRQEVNQLLAREGSITGALATLDLSEASDRVSNELVRFLTGRWQHLDGAIQACRSRQAVVRLSEKESVTVSLRKFASMGSALTFPLESAIFLIVALVGIEQSLGRRLRESDLAALSGTVAVYGDDMIVPTDHVRSVVHALVSFGFKVNSHKSFWTGKFRESCGKDYYSGVDVSYVKFRKLWPDDRQDVEEVVALVSFFNQCKDAHYPKTTSFLRKKLRTLLWGYFPRVGRDSAILGEWDDVDHDVTGFCEDYHRPLTKGWMTKPHVPVNPLDGERALLKFFLKDGAEPSDEGHLERSGRSKDVSIYLCEGYASA